MLSKLNTSMILEISNNLTDYELLEVFSTNKMLKNDIENLFEQRKKLFLNNLFNYFTFDIHEKLRFSIRTQYDNYYEKYVKKLFTCIPELFTYIHNNNITKLDLSCVTSYGGYPRDIIEFVQINLVPKLLRQLYEFINSNLSHTLEYCNFGLFEHNINKNEFTKNKLTEIIASHPSIKYVSIRCEGATINTKTSSTLYNRNGILEWKFY
jgi:hypothetical protein